uniref:Peptidase_M41 domain-containing protein n=1 Tax=Caenorhabditis japonica TaxID=281687 RepID=A0A8R1EME6_CAEJA
MFEIRLPFGPIFVRPIRPFVRPSAVRPLRPVGLRDFTAEDKDNSLVKVSELSPHTAEIIDSEINRVLAESYKRAKDILEAKKKEHQLLAEALLEYETLSADEVRRVISGQKIKRPTSAAVKKSNEMKRNQPSLVLHLFEEEGRGKQ